MRERCPHCGIVAPVWTRQRIIGAAKLSTRVNGRPPRARDWTNAAPEHPASSTAKRVFGTWNQMLQAAGLPTRVAGPGPKYSRDDVLHAILVWKFERGRLPRFNEWTRKTGDHPTTAVVIRVFGSWNAAIVAAGYEPTMVKQGRDLDSYRRIAGNAARRFSNPTTFERAAGQDLDGSRPAAQGGA